MQADREAKDQLAKICRLAERTVPLDEGLKSAVARVLREVE
jgi:imidazoleglycerol phosphate dehydratase HisB